MTTYELDYELSLEIYERYSVDIKPKECYKNVFKVSPYVLTHYPDAKIAYGAVKPQDMTFYIKHAYFLYKGKAIDPTLFVWNDARPTAIKNNSYVVAQIFTMVEMFKALEVENFDTALTKTTRRQYNTLMQSLLKNNIYLIG